MSWTIIFKYVGYAVGGTLLVVGVTVYYTGYLIYYTSKYTYLGIRWCVRKINNYYTGNNNVVRTPINSSILNNWDYGTNDTTRENSGRIYLDPTRLIAVYINNETGTRNSDFPDIAPTHMKSRDRSKIRDDCCVPTSDVRMPTGEFVSVTVPSTPHCQCKQLSESKLIPLWPKSKVCSQEYNIVSNQMNKTIVQHNSGNYSSYQIISIHKVQNCCLWTKFWNRQVDIGKENNSTVNQRMFFHGSAVVDHIVTKGFDERNSNIHGMFGAGVYFASHSSKSNQYVFGYMGGKGCPLHSNANCLNCERKMLLCRVTLGRTQNLTSGGASKMAHAPPGYHSVTGVPTPNGLRYPEYVIYRGEQAYPEYLITYRIKL